MAATTDAISRRMRGQLVESRQTAAFVSGGNVVLR